MKTKKFLLTVLLFAGCFSHKLFAQQVQFTVTMVDSFPVLPDTAHENQQANFNIHVYNLDSGLFIANNYLRIFLRNTDTTQLTLPEQVLDSMYIDTLSGFDTINFYIQGYVFTSATYRAGNNIIVVWPRIGSNINTTHDSLTLDTVWYEPLLSVNMLTEHNQAFSIYPNPVMDEIKINAEGEKSIEYVRILNDLGETVISRRYIRKHLDVRFLSKGFYFIEIKEQNGTLSRRKFLKL